MTLQVRNRRDFYAGLMFALFGILFGGAAARYDIGLLAQMGPGWFPVTLGILLTGLGVLIALGACRVSASRAELDAIAWRELGFVLLSIAMFALLLPVAGAIISVVVLVVVCACAGSHARPLEVGVVALVLAAICDLVFIRGLGLPIETWPPFLFGG